MRKTVQMFIVLGIILVTFVLPVILFNVSKKPIPSQNQNNSLTPTASTEETNTVRFDSIPPTFAITGGTFMYQVKVNDTKGEKVTVTVQEKPEWVEWNEETLVLRGTVPKSANASFDITIKAVNTKGDVTTQSFTVAIEEATRGSQEVKGIKDSGWKDPFHPAVAGVEGIYDGEPEPTTESDVLGVSTGMPTPTADVAGTNEDPDYALLGVYIGAGVAIGIIVLGGVYMAMSTDKQEFIRGTGKLIVERGRK